MPLHIHPLPLKSSGNIWGKIPLLYVGTGMNDGRGEGRAACTIQCVLCTGAHPRFTCRTHAPRICRAATTHSSHPEQFHSTRSICVTKCNRSGLDKFTWCLYAEHLQIRSVRALLREGGSHCVKGILRHQRCQPALPSVT